MPEKVSKSPEYLKKCQNFDYPFWRLNTIFYDLKNCWFFLILKILPKITNFSNHRKCCLIFKNGFGWVRKSKFWHFLRYSGDFETFFGIKTPYFCLKTPLKQSKCPSYHPVRRNCVRIWIREVKFICTRSCQRQDYASANAKLGLKLT